MNTANYLSFAIASGLLNKVELVMHREYKFDVDLPTRFFKDTDYRSNYLQLKGYEDA